MSLCVNPVQCQSPVKINGNFRDEILVPPSGRYNSEASELCRKKVRVLTNFEGLLFVFAKFDVVVLE